MGRYSRNFKAAGAAIVSLGTLLTASLFFSFSSSTSVTPESARYGWAGPEEVKAAAPIVAGMQPFRIVGAAPGEDNTGKNVRLWDHAIAVLGKHIPNYAQETGDCVSFGAKNAISYLLVTQMKTGPPGLEYHENFPPYIYGISRVQIGGGRLGRGAGSVGAWAAKGVMEYGVLRSDQAGVDYSGRLADQWGQKGPPKELIEKAKQFLVKTTSPIRSAAEARDALCNGYPVTIASDWGSTNMREVDGRIVARRNTNWPHQMCLIAYDGATGREPYFYVINSWGESAHPKPLQGEPAGGFWISTKDVDYITRQGDSFAFSNFDGFPARELDFTVIGKQSRAQAPVMRREELQRKEPPHVATYRIAH